MSEMKRVPSIVTDDRPTGDDMRQMQADADTAAAAATADPPLLDQCKELLMGSKINVLYVCVPIAIICAMAGAPETATFVFSFLALVPLAAALGDLTEDLALRTNDVIGALINVTFGNATELIISFAALRRGDYAVIKNSLLGSILGNMLLVLGTSLLVAGVKQPLISFNKHSAQTYMSSLVLASFAFIVPTIFFSINPDAGNPYFDLALSRELSFLLIIIYVAYLYFQVKTHKSFFESVPSPRGGAGAPNREGAEASSPTPASDTSKPIVADTNGAVDTEAEANDDDDEDEEPKFSFVFAVVATGVVAVIISVLSDLLVDSITPAADGLRVGKHFITLVLVPIVGNVAEHASAILMARKGKVDIAIGVALGSSIQIAMFAMPLTVIVSWVFGRQLNMNVNPFVASTLFATVLLTYVVIAPGTSTWLSGSKLLVAYFILALAFLHAPDDKL